MKRNEGLWLGAVCTALLLGYLLISNLATSSPNHGGRFATAKPVTPHLLPPNENPGPFWQDLDEVKQSSEGRAYRDHYQVIELEKAVRRGKKSHKPIPWTSRGPGNVSGRLRTLIIDPSDPSRKTWFAGAVTGGVWKTTDAGTTWTHKTSSLPTLATANVVMAPSNPDVLYVGTGLGFGFSYLFPSGAGIWKSIDGGETWNVLPET